MLHCLCDVETALQMKQIATHGDNTTNLRDLIAAAGLVTLFGQCDLEIAWMTVKNNHLQTLKSDPHLQFLGLCNLEI